LAVKKKIVLLGDSAVGKTSLIRRFVLNQFRDSYIATIGSKVTTKDLKIQKSNKTEHLTLVIWDLIGREGYLGLHSRTFVGVHGALIVADLTRRDTLENLEQYWIPALFKVVDNVPLVFACNKSDLKGQFEFELDDLTEVASKYHGDLGNLLPSDLEPNYSTSAKDGSNVEKAFESLGHLVLCTDELADPIKEIFESVAAMGVSRTTDKTIPIGALDSIITDFCEDFEDSKVAMLILRQEFARAGLDVNKPTKESILKVVEYLAEAETELKSEETVISNLKRRLEIANKIRE